MANRVSQLSLVAEWDWPGVTYYYAAGETVTIEGHTYENRITDANGLRLPFMDGRKADFGEVSLELCNLANDGSASFPFQALDAIDDFEDKQLRIRIYDHVAADWVFLWFGVTKRPEYNPDTYTATITATFVWDAIEMELPSRKLSHGCTSRFGAAASYETNFGLVPSVACPYDTFGTPGFAECPKDKPACTARGMLDFHYGLTHIAPQLDDGQNNSVDRATVRDSAWPVIYADREAKYRVEVVRFQVVGEEGIANFLISGVHPGLPFAEGDLVASKVKLADEIRATWVKFLPGEGPGGIAQTIGGNRNVWPDKFGGHTYVAHAAARFKLTKEQADKFSDSFNFHNISVKLPTGRRTLRSGLPTENLVRILEDLLRDKILGPGIPGSDFDDAAVLDAINYNSTRFHGRVELDKPEPLLDVVRRFLLNFHGFITMNNGKYQIRCKKHNETAVASFGNGQTYYINKLKVKAKERDFSETTNELAITFRDINRRRTQSAYYDSGAQIKAGNGLVKKVAEELFLYSFEESEARISAAINLRESLQLNLDIEFEVDLSDFLASGVVAGDVIKVKSPHIYNNGSNELFRVESPEINWKQKTVSVPASLYYGVIYGFNADNLGGDISRGGVGNTNAGRPPDVESVDAYQISFKADDDNPMAMLAADWQYPDLTAELAEDRTEGIESRYPIKAVQIKWRYGSDPFDKFEDGPRIEYPQNHAEWPVPFHKGEEVAVWFVAVGQNNGTGEVGYILDAAAVTYIDASAGVTSADTSFPVDDPGLFTPGDLYRIEEEIGEVASTTVSAMLPVLDTGVRDTLGDYRGNFGQGTEIGVCNPSHPIDTVDLSTRRFLYPVVTGVTIRNRRTGILVEWEDVDRERVEWYIVYYATTASGATGLDTANTTTTIAPAWYLADPKTPPAGISFIRTRHKHRAISYEKLGVPAGTPVFVRVVAQIKQNFSSAISILASGKHTHGPSEPPADPVAGDIHQDIVEGSNRVRITFDVYASVDRALLAGRTWADVGATFAGLKLQKWNRGLGAWEAPIEWAPAIDDLSTKVATISRAFHKGSRWRIKRAYDGNDAANAHSSDVLLEFRPGTVSDDTSAITDLQIRTFTDPSIPSVEISAREADIVATFTQPATPVALEEIRYYKRKSGVTKYNGAGRENLRGAAYHTAGLKEIHHSVAHPRLVDAAMMDYKVELIGADGSVVTALYSAAPSAEASGGVSPITQVPSTPVDDPNHIFKSAISGDPSKMEAELGFYVYAGATGVPTFAGSNIEHAAIGLKIAGSTAEKIRSEPVSGSTAVRVPIVVTAPLGSTVLWLYNETHNSTPDVERSTAGGGGIPIVAGRDSYIFDANSLTSVSLTVSSINAHLSNLLLQFTQPTKPVFIKHVAFERSVDAGSTYQRINPDRIADESDTFNVAGLQRLRYEARHPKNTSVLYRAYIIVAGGNRASSTTLLVTQSATSANEADPVTNPATVPAAPAFIRATIGNGGLSARYAKPADARPYLQYYEFQFSDSPSATSATARDWLDPDSGSLAYASTAPNVDTDNAPATNLVNATRHAGVRYTANDLRKRDLDFSFTSNVEHGAISLYVRARIVDTDAAGALRYGNWSTWGTVLFRSNQDRDTDVPSHNHGGNSYNPLEGFGCYTDSQFYPTGAHAGGTTMGRKFYCAIGVVPASDEATALDTFPGKKWNGSAYVPETGNPFDAGNRGLYWNKSLACVEVYGQAGGTHYVTQFTTTFVTLSCKAPGIYLIGDVWWFVCAIASFNSASLASSGTVIAQLWDGASNVGRSTLASISIALTNNWKLVAFRINVVSTFTNSTNIWLRMLFPTFSLSTNHRLLIKNGIMQKGNSIPRIWYPGKEESTLEANSGVSLADSRGLAALYNTAGWGTDGLSSSGELTP